MSFLLGGEYDSSGSSGDSESEADQQQEQRQDSLDGEERGDGDDSERREAVAALPSADSVLDCVSKATASFHAPRSAASAASTSLKVFDLLEEEKQQRHEKQREERNAGRMKQEQQRKRLRDGNEDAPSSTANRDHNLPAKKDKRDAKERVKQQRVKGQAGIGSDFRAWKSETEMALRQQFD